MVESKKQKERKNAAAAAIGAGLALALIGIVFGGAASIIFIALGLAAVVTGAVGLMRSR